MANSYIYYAGNGSLTTFTTPPYLEESHLEVVVGGIIQALGVDYTLSGTSLTFTTAPANALEIRIARSSSRDTRLTDYSDASLLTADTLDLDSNQLFYLSQEAFDTASETNISGAKFYTSSISVPSDPVIGNLWFDINTKSLKIYDGTVWKLAIPTNSSQKFLAFNNDEAGYSYVSLFTVDESALVFLNGVKQVRSETKGGLITTPTTGDYFVDLDTNRVYFAPLSVGDVVEVVVNLINNNGGGTGEGTGGSGGYMSISYNEAGGYYELTDSLANISIIVGDGNDAGVAIPTITDNGIGADGVHTYTMNNGSGQTITWRDGVDGEMPQLGFDYFNGIDGSFRSFIYNVSTTQPDTPIGGDFNGTAELFPVGGWSDNPTASAADIEWVSTTTYTQAQDESWSNNGWSTPSLFFQAGADGANGTSVSIKGTFASTSSLVGRNAALGDAYIIAGELWVCTTASNNTLLSYFTNVGQFVGAAGQSSYIHYAYASNPFAVDPNNANFHVSDATDRDYLGVYVDASAQDSGDVTHYTWSLIKGVDGVSINWKGTLTAAPADAVNGWSYYNSTDGKSYLYQDGQWYQTTVDGADGTNGTDGMVWKSSSATPPLNPELNWAYKDTDDGVVYIYNGTAWEVMSENGTNGDHGEDGEDGADGLNVYVVYHEGGLGTAPDKPHNRFLAFVNTLQASTYPANGWSELASADSNWMCQKVGLTNNNNSDAWGEPIRITGFNGANGTHGANGAGQFSGNMVGSTFTYAQADAVVLAVAKRAVVVGDVVTLSKQSDRSKIVTRVCTSVNNLGAGAWTETVELFVDGALIVDGTIIGEKIAANAISSDKIKVNTLTADRIMVNTLDVGGKAVAGSIGMCEGVAGVSVEMSGFTTQYEPTTIDYSAEPPYHINSDPNHTSYGGVLGLPYVWFKENTPSWQTATLFSDGVWAPINDYWLGNSNGSIENFTGMYPYVGTDIADFSTPVLMSHSFTTHNFTGTQPFIIDWSATVGGYFTEYSLPTFAMAVRQTADQHAYMSTDPDDYVSTSIVYSQGVGSGGTTNMNELVSLEGNKTYHIWIFGLLQEVWPISSSTGEIASRVGDARGISNGKITVQGLNA